MRPRFASLATAILIAGAAGLDHGAHAASGVLHCAMPDGTDLYTNKACSSFGGKGEPLPVEVLNRIESQQRLEARLTGMQYDDPGLLPQNAVSTRRDVASGCAATPLQLAMDLQASVALRDVNRVAESFDWAGMHNTQAQRVMEHLERLARADVLDAEYFDSGFDTGEAADGIGSSPAGVMQVALNGDEGRRVADFDVRKDSGCYFLRYA